MDSHLEIIKELVWQGSHPKWFVVYLEWESSRFPTRLGLHWADPYLPKILESGHTFNGPTISIILDLKLVFHSVDGAKLWRWLTEKGASEIYFPYVFEIQIQVCDYDISNILYCTHRHPMRIFPLMQTQIT